MVFDRLCDSLSDGRVRSRFLIATLVTMLVCIEASDHWPGWAPAWLAGAAAVALFQFWTVMRWIGRTS